MENATKALLMAGGVLIALLVVGALVLMWNQISAYQASNSDNEKSSQLADFNKEYVKYTYDDIYGYELISLANKIYDHNVAKKDVGNSFPYQEIFLEITLGNEFKNEFAIKGNEGLFDNKYTSVDDFINDANWYYEHKDKDLKTLYSNLTALENYEKYADLCEYNFTIGQSELNAEKDNNVRIKAKEDKCNNVANENELVGSWKYATIDKIYNYREYSEFKTSKFEVNDSIEYYDNGQIKKLSFKYKK